MEGDMLDAIEVSRGERGRIPFQETLTRATLTGSSLELSRMRQDPVLCSECGWTGFKSDLEARDGVRSCPVCDTDAEFVD